MLLQGLSQIDLAEEKLSEGCRLLNKISRFKVPYGHLAVVVDMKPELTVYILSTGSFMTAHNCFIISVNIAIVLR